MDKDNVDPYIWKIIYDIETIAGLLNMLNLKHQWWYWDLNYKMSSYNTWMLP